MHWSPGFVTWHAPGLFGGLRQVMQCSFTWQFFVGVFRCVSTILSLASRISPRTVAWKWGLCLRW